MHPTTQAFANRRVFAYSDTGIPDGIQVDNKGNIWSGNGDGVHVRFVLTSPLAVFAHIFSGMEPGRCTSRENIPEHYVRKFDFRW